MSNQQENKNANAILWGIIGITLLCLVLWGFFSDEFKAAFLFIRKWELYLAEYLTMPFNLHLDAQVARKTAEKITFYEVNKYYFTYLSNTAGIYLRWVVIVLIAIMAYIIGTRNVAGRYKKTYNMKSLREQESPLWPQISPVCKLDLLNEDLNKGPWAMCLTPILFCEKYKILRAELAEGVRDILYKGPEFKAVVNKAKAKRVFSAQLGRVWRGVEAMPIHRRALFACFISRVCRDSKSSDKMLAQLSVSYAAGKLDCSGVDALWQKHVNKKEVQDFYNSHAFEVTLLATALERARDDGVLATSSFIWLKPVDRILWYTLNDVGRQVGSCEAAGPFTHRRSEQLMKRPLSVPMVQEAVLALEQAVAEIIYEPPEEEKEKIRNEAYSKWGMEEKK